MPLLSKASGKSSSVCEAQLWQEASSKVALYTDTWVFSFLPNKALFQKSLSASQTPTLSSFPGGLITYLPSRVCCANSRTILFVPYQRHFVGFGEFSKKSLSGIRLLSRPLCACNLFGPCCQHTGALVLPGRAGILRV